MKIELQNIAATAEGLYEYDSGKVLVHIPKDEINKLSFGFVAPIRWPITSIAIGALLIIAGIFWGVVPLLNAISAHSNSFPNMKGFALISLHILFGIYFVRLGLRKKHCLIVETNKGSKMLVLSKPIEEQKSAEFINQMAQQFEYPI